MGAILGVIGRLNGKLDLGKLILIQSNSTGAVAVVIPKLTRHKAHAARVG